MVFEGDNVRHPPPSDGFSGVGTVSVLQLVQPPSGAAEPEGTVAPNPNCTFQATLPITDPAVAVAFNPARPTQVVVQTQQPSSLVIVDDINQFFGLRTIAFDDGATLDTGYQLFHRDSGGGIACATCHAEGAEDGNVWRFDGIGARRTQALNVGLDGTAPFHWDGTLFSVGMLMSEVFVGRMGGIHESPARLRGLEDWIFSQRPLKPLRDANDAAVLRGKEIYESPSVGCASCHGGQKFTNNQSRYVGTDERVLMQVPSLVGIGYRAPFMHDGCAPTLAARFDPACGGGEEHGRTAHLTQAELDDLVAYLESL
jgi:mono/diheme cytochrome c family protein